MRLWVFFFTLALGLGIRLPIAQSSWNVRQVPQAWRKLGIHAVEWRKDPRTHEWAVFLLDRNSKVLRKVIVGPSDPNSLMKFQPGRLQRLKDSFKNSPQWAFQSLKTIPLEAFSFFLALGAVTSWELLTRYERNPLGAQIFWESQKDPVGLLSLAAFIVVNGAVAQPFHLMLTDTKFLFLSPYLAMTVGMTASHIIHELGHFPNLRECALYRRGCDQAYEAWINLRMAEKWDFWATSLTSMIISGVLSGIVQELAVKSVSHAWRIVGLELFWNLTPQGRLMQVGRLVFRAGQFTLFLFIDHQLNPWIHSHYQKWLGVAHRLNQLQEEIQKEANQPTLESANLCPLTTEPVQTLSCHVDVAKKVEFYRRDFQTWQESTQASLWQSLYQWNQFFNQIIAEYVNLRNFYIDFTSFLWTQKYEYDNLKMSSLWVKAPLWGLPTDHQNTPRVEDYWLRPNRTQQAQWLYWPNVRQKLLQDPQISRWVSLLSSFERQQWLLLNDLWSRQDPESIGRGWRLVRVWAQKDRPLGSMFKVKNSPLLWLIGQRLLQLMPVEPDPLLAHGDVFVRVWSLMNGVEESKVYNWLRGMVWGVTNPSQMFPENMRGLPIKVKPLSLVRSYPNYPFRRVLPEDAISTDDQKIVHEYPATQDTGGQRQNAYEFLLESIREDFLSHRGYFMADYWHKVIDQEFLKVLNRYQTVYEKWAQDWKNLLISDKQVSSRSKLYSGQVLKDLVRFVSLHLQWLQLAQRHQPLDANKLLVFEKNWLSLMHDLEKGLRKTEDFKKHWRTDWLINLQVWWQQLDKTIEPKDYINPRFVQSIKNSIRWATERTLLMTMSLMLMEKAQKTALVQDQGLTELDCQNLHPLIRPIVEDLCQQKKP